MNGVLSGPNRHIGPDPGRYRIRAEEEIRDVWGAVTSEPGAQLPLRAHGWDSETSDLGVAAVADDPE